MYAKFVFAEDVPTKVSRHLVFWLVWVLFFTFIYGYKGIGYYGFWRSQLISLAEAIAFLPIHIFFSYTLLYVLMPRYMKKHCYGTLLMWMIPLTVAVGFVSHWCATYLVFPFHRYMGVPTQYHSIPFGFMAGLRGGLTVGGFAAAIKLFKQWYARIMENEWLKSARMETELQILRAQLHPHFLFNTLNNIYSYALQDTKTAPDMLLRLSDMLRYMLYECNRDEVPLSREIKLLNDYIALEQMRYGDRLETYVKIEVDVLAYSIAPLLLLPFLENCFKHGSATNAWISIEMWEEEGMVKLKMLNGKGNETRKEGEHGIGLNNLRKRLEWLYSGKHHLYISNQEDHFLVKLSIQLKAATPENVNSLTVPQNNPVYA